MAARISSASVDKTVRLWLSSPAGWLALACPQFSDHRSLMAPVNNVMRETKSTCERRGRR